MEVECLALKDLTSVGKSFSVPKEDGRQGEKVGLDVLFTVESTPSQLHPVKSGKTFSIQL